jgi:hypothetical protein
VLSAATPHLELERVLDQVIRAMAQSLQPAQPDTDTDADGGDEGG